MEGLHKGKSYRNPSGEPPRAALQEKLLKRQSRRNTPEETLYDELPEQLFRKGTLQRMLPE